MSNKIFVFGSNLAGIHGAGSARAAHKDHGAVWGCGIGHQGDSYAIPTKDAHIQTLPIEDVAIHVGNFLDYAHAHPELTFDIVAIGCGLAGFKPEEIAPLFKFAPLNCNLPEDFLNALEKTL